jgi:hypothetical protein
MFDQEGSSVEFRLLYSGRLLGASRSNTRADMKHSLRRQFHPQLRRLWATAHGLDQLSRHQDLSLWVAKHPGVDLQKFTDAQFRQAGVETISYRWSRGGFNCVPLITSELSLRCRLDILFLRPDEAPYVMKGGDLDGRLKTLFDALRLPSDHSETGGQGPQEDENPLFCLMEDDKLISEISVVTDQLLVLPSERDIDPNDVFLVVHVHLTPSSPRSFDNYF